MKRFFCAIWEHIEYIFVLLLFVGVFYLAFSYNSYAGPDYSSSPEYTNRLFDDSKVHKIEVVINPTDLASLRENPREKDKYVTTVTIDGQRFEKVSFSTRGNGSLGTVASLPDSNRYSYTLNFHKFNEHGSYYGLDKIALNSLVEDPSYLKDYLAYRIVAATDLDYPFTSFTELYINGELNGLYLALEGVDQAFLKRTNSSSDAALFHPVPYSIDHDRIKRDSRALPEGETGAWENDMGYDGSDFVYRGDAVESYDSIFENAVTKYSKRDETFIIEAIESLSEYSLRNPEDYWDIDSIIKFFVVGSLIPNSDSYLGGTAQNYYLKLSNGKLSLIPWDFDRAFHLEEESLEGSTSKDNAVLWPIDNPLINVSSKDERPLWRLIANNPEYMEQYHDVLQAVLDEYMFSGKCVQELETAASLIRQYVYSDPTKLTTIDGFEQEVDYLHHFILPRADSIQRQLWGIDSSTKRKGESQPKRDIVDG